MNVNDLFADDLNSFDAVMAQLTGEQDNQAHLSATSSGASTAPVPAMQAHSAELEGRRGRREVLVPRDLGRQPQPQRVTSDLSLRSPKAVVTDDSLMPWDIDDTTRQNQRLHASTRGLRAALAGVANTIELDEDDDPLAFLNKGVSQTAAVVAPTCAVSGAGGDIAVPGQQRHWEIDQEIRKEEERRDLLSSLDALGIEHAELQNALETLQIKADTELTQLETTIIEKRTKVASHANDALNRQRECKEYSQRRLKEISERTIELIRRQEEEVMVMERERYEKQLHGLLAAATDVQARVDQLLQQRELLLQHHRYDEKGIFLALAEEETMQKERLSFAGGGDGGVDDATASTSNKNNGSSSSSMSVVDAKLGAALRLLWRHHTEHLESFSSNVVQYIHTETMDVAREVRERHELACFQDLIVQKEELSEFMQKFLRRYRDFFRHRAELRSRNMAFLRHRLQEASEQLHVHSRQRLERHMREVTANMDELTQRFGKLAVESAERVLNKAAVLRESDESVARNQMEDLRYRCQAEEVVTEKLQRSEVEVLQKQLDMMRRWSDDQRNVDQKSAVSGDDVGVLRHQRVAQDICTAMAESITRKVHELESVVQQRLREQLSRNDFCHVEEGNMLLTDDGLAVRMNLQEKKAVISSLLEEVKNRQTELLSTRLRCGELREQIAAALQEEVQTARQQRLAQEAQIANSELFRIAWEREQRELLKWGSETMFFSGEPCSSVTAGRTHLPVATTTLDVMNLVVERNCALVKNRAKLAAELQQLFNTMMEERDDILAERREVETRWFRLCEQLVDLMEGQDAVATRRGAATVEAAKLEAAGELLSHDKELYHNCCVRAEEEVNRLKREFRETLAAGKGQDAPRWGCSREQSIPAWEQEHVVAEGTSLQRAPCAGGGYVSRVCMADTVV